MTDNDVEIAVRKQLLAQLAQAGINIPVRAGFQSAKQGREDNFVMFFPAGENPQGWQKRSYNPQGSDAGHLEAQQYETTFQVQAFITEFSGYTAKDITAFVRMIVNSLPFVEALRKQGIGVQRATAIRLPYFVNDRGDYEQNPSFDFNVTYTSTLRPETAAVTALYPDIHRI